MTIDDKIKFYKNNILAGLNRKLKMCSCLFFLFGIMMMGSAMSTFFGAKYNAAHIAETGKLPWGPSRVEGFVPSDQPVEHQFDLYDNFLKMALMMVLLGFTMFAFVKRTMIARWCQKSTVSRRAFRRTLFCMAFYAIVYYFLKNQTKEFMDTFKSIAEAKNVTLPESLQQPEQGRVLQAFNNGFSNHQQAWDGMMNFKGFYNADEDVDTNMPPQQQQPKQGFFWRFFQPEDENQQPQEEETDEEQKQKREEWMKYWGKVFPWTVKSDNAETENAAPKKHHLGFCPVTAFVVLCMIG